MTHDPLSQIEIHRIAENLARLKLTEAQEQQTAKDFERILDHVDTLATADTTEVDTQLFGASDASSWRDDTIQPSLPVEEALRMAPERLGDGFGVPKIIE